MHYKHHTSSNNSNVIAVITAFTNACPKRNISVKAPYSMKITTRYLLQALPKHNIGVAADADGKYSISVPRNGVLIFSSAGYLNQKFR